MLAVRMEISAHRAAEVVEWPDRTGGHGTMSHEAKVMHQFNVWPAP
jgi:hypothetical protein